MDANNVFQDIGEIGWYQLFICIYLSMTVIGSAFSTLNVIFIMGVMDFSCNIPQLQHLNITKEDIANLTFPVIHKGESNRISQCYMYDRNYSGWTKEDVDIYKQFDNVDNASTILCQDGWWYDTEVFGETAATEWDLVCKKKWWQAAAASFYQFGLLSSFMIYGTIADTFGRKPVFCIYIVLYIMCNFATAMSPGYIFLIGTRFLCGFFAASFIGGGSLLAIELIGPKYREHINAVFGYMWPPAGILMACLAYMIRDWRTLQYVLSSIMLIYLGYIFVLPESPRWLYSKNRRDKADKIFIRIAKSNKRTFVPRDFQYEKLKEATGPVFLWRLFYGKSMLIRTTVTCFNWFSVSLTYYGLLFNSTSLSGNVYLNFIISMLTEIPGVILCHVITVKIGRKWPLVISKILSGVILILTLLHKSDSTGMIILVNMGKMVCTLAFNIMFIYMLELYPTVIRSTAFSLGLFISRIGSIVAPFIAQLSDFNLTLPMLIYGVGSLLAGLSAILLPETIGKELEDSLQQSILQGIQKEEDTQTCIKKPIPKNVIKNPEEIATALM